MERDGKFDKVTLCYIDGIEAAKKCMKSWAFI